MILLYTTGSKQEGLGHAYRTLALAYILLAQSSPFICVINDDPIMAQLFGDNHIPTTHSDLVETLFRTQPIHVILTDTRSDVSKLMTLARQQAIPILALDCLSPSRLLADLNIYPNPHFLWQNLDWEGYTGDILGGAEYTVLHPRFIKAKSSLPAPNLRKRILISFGGSDPNGLTQHILPWTIKAKKDWALDVVIGPGFDLPPESRNLYSDSVIFHENCVDLCPLMCHSGVLITALGMTIYEAALLHLPSLVISNFKTDFRDEAPLRQISGIFPLGFYKDVLEIDFISTLTYVMQTPDFQPQIGGLLDGLGAQRIVDVLHQMW